MNRNIRIPVPCFVLVLVMLSACNGNDETVMRAYDAQNNRMIVLTGDKTKITNFYDTDFVVIGGGIGGIAAALAICESGRSVYLIEESDRIAGCFSGSGVYASPADALVEKAGMSRNYRAFRAGIQAWYGKNGKTPPSNTGGFCFGGDAALAVIGDMLKEKVASGQLTVLKRHKVAKVTRYERRIASLQTIDLDNQCVDQVVGYGYIDATEHGDLFPLAGIPYVAGSEGAADTGEPHAAANADSLAAMRMCCCADSGMAGEKGTGHRYVLTVREDAAVPGFCAFPVMRESRRIRALDRITEQDIAAGSQPGPRARFRPDAVGVGYSPIVIETPDGKMVTLETRPFQIPLGALIPEDCDNLLAGNANLGATRIAAGAFRAPEIEWAVGEAAGYAIAFYAGYKAPLPDLLKTPEHLATFQHLLAGQYDVPIYWYDDIAPGDADFAGAQLAPFANPSVAETAKTLHRKT